MKASAYWKRQLPCYVGAFESTCAKGTAHAELFRLPCLDVFRPVSAQRPLSPRKNLGTLHRGTFFSPSSLLNVAETLVAIRMPGPSQGSAVPAGDTAGNLHCCCWTLGQSRQEPWAGLPDPGVDQQLDLGSVSKQSSILLTD